MNRFLSVHKVLVFLLIGVLATSCKTSQQTASAGKDTNLSEENKTKLMYFFVNANKEKILGNEGRALELFAECLKIDPRNDASLYEMAQLYANRKKYVSGRLPFESRSIKVSNVSRLKKSESVTLNPLQLFVSRIEFAAI